MRAVARLDDAHGEALDLVGKLRGHLAGSLLVLDVDPQDRVAGRGCPTAEADVHRGHAGAVQPLRSNPGQRRLRGADPVR